MTRVNPYERFKINQRVNHERFGDGTVVDHDGHHDDVLNADVFTGRIGVVFDNHTFIAVPAYFWPEELT